MILSLSGVHLNALTTAVLLLFSTSCAASLEKSDIGRHRRHSLLSKHTARSVGYHSVGYFPNDVIYARNFQPSNIVPSKLTHILYSFADINPSDGTVFLTDLYADQQKHYKGDSWTETGNNLYGNFKQLYLLKQKQRNLKVLLSIGGYVYSQDGHFNFISNAQFRANFVTSAVQLLEDNGLDGIDIDFEYPTAAQKENFVSLVSALRTALDNHATSKGDKVPYQLSAAVPAGAADYVHFDVKAMDAHLTFWNLMSYDYAGPWSTVSDDQANLYRGATKEGIDTDTVLKWYIAQGATKSKLNMGIPLYGRSFENTTGIEKSYSGVGAGSWTAGIWDVKVLPFAGAKVTEDLTTGASYSYDATKKELISFDTPVIVKEKAVYVMSHGLGGMMYWDLSSDYVGSSSLVASATSVFGALDQTENHLSYPGSQFANMKTCMGACPAKATVSPCKSLGVWSSKTSYKNDVSVQYESYVWTSDRASKGEVPGGKAGGWKKGKAC